MSDYEAAVYDEECLGLTRAILAVCQEAEKIPDKRVRAAIISSALVTAAQVLDGNDMPSESRIIKPGGVAANICLICAAANPPGEGRDQ